MGGLLYKGEMVKVPTPAEVTFHNYIVPCCKSTLETLLANANAKMQGVAATLGKELEEVQRGSRPRFVPAYLVLSPPILM